MNISKVFLRVNRVDAAICRQARDVTVSDLHEALAETGRGGLMSSRMRPLTQGARIAGPAVTAYCAAGDNLMMHRALYLAQSGDVLVVVAESETAGAVWGDMATRYAQHKGLAGVIVQGCARDSDTVRSLGLPVWATHVSATHPEKSGHGLVNAPIICDGVLVNPGDLIVADGDGVVCVAREDAQRALERAQAGMRREDELIQALGRGEALWDLIGARAPYAALRVEEIDGAFDD